MADRTLPGIGLKNKWATGESGWGTDTDLNWQTVDALLHATVINYTTTTPPVSPTQGDRYLVPSGATGAWATNIGALAEWIDGAWAYYPPQAGYEVYVKASATKYRYSGTAWAAIAASAGGVLIQQGTTTVQAGTLAAGSNVTITQAGTSGEFVIAASGGGGGSSLALQLGGTPETATTLNFGTNLSGSVTGGVLTINSTGGGSLAVEVAGTVETAGTINFGSGLTGVVAGGTLTIATSITTTTATFDPAEVGGSSVLSNGNLTFTGTNSGSFNWTATRATGAGATSGKFYYEVTTQTISGGIEPGVCNAACNLGSFLGVDSNGCGFVSNGNYESGGSQTADSLSWTAGATVGVAFDVTAGKIWIRGASGWESGDPGAGTGGHTIGVSGALWPALGANSAGAQATVNFGAAAFAFPVPAGFGVWSPTTTTIGASSGKPLFDISAGVPALSAMTYFGPGGDTTVESAGKAIFLSPPGSQSSAAIRGYTKPAPSAPYRVAIFLLGSVATVYSQTGVGWMDASGKIHWMSIQEVLYVQEWNSNTSYAGTEINSLLTPADASAGIWFGLRDDGTNFYFEYSYDSVNFVTVYSGAKSGAFLADFNKVFFGINPNENSMSIPLAVTLRCWDEAGLTRTFP